MNAAEQRERRDLVQRLNKQIEDICAILEAHTAAIAMLARRVQALEQRLEDEQRHTLVDLRGNRLRVGGGH